VKIRVVAPLTRLVTVGSVRLVLFVIHVSIGPPDYYLGAAVFHIRGPSYLGDVGDPFIPLGPVPGPPKRWGLLPSRPFWKDGVEFAFVPNLVHRLRWDFGPSNTGVLPTLRPKVQISENVAFVSTPRPKGPVGITEYDTHGHIVASSRRFITPLSHRP
jgi:hypothetical protein